MKEINWKRFFYIELGIFIITIFLILYGLNDLDLFGILVILFGTLTISIPVGITFSLPRNYFKKDVNHNQEVGNNEN